MYHFIRRFFIFVLVLAFGFSFLLCCFVHGGFCQSNLPWHYPAELPGMEPSPSGYYLTTQLPDFAMPEGYYATWGPQGMTGITQFILGGRIASNVQSYARSMSQFLFSGSTSSGLYSNSLQPRASIQQFNPLYLGLPSDTAGAAGTVGYGYGGLSFTGIPGIVSQPSSPISSVLGDIYTSPSVHSTLYNEQAQSFPWWDTVMMNSVSYNRFAPMMQSRGNDGHEIPGIGPEWPES
jgi:hypothetical protein